MKFYYLIPVLLLFGCIGGSQQSVTATPTPTPTLLPSDQTLDQLAAVISSGMPYKCDINIEGVTTEMWVKGENYKMISHYAGQTMEYIKNGEIIYMHLPDGKWYSMELSNEPAEMPSNIEVPKIESMPKVGYKCVPNSFSDSLIAPPVGAIDFDNYISSMMNISIPSSMPPLDNDTAGQLNNCSNYVSIDCEMLPGELKSICKSCKGQ